MTIEENALIPIGRAAEMLGVSVMTLRRWDEDGILRSVRFGERGTRYYRPSDLEQFLKGGSDRQDLAAVAKKWVSDVNPIPLEPSMYCQTSDMFLARLQRLKNDLEKKYGKTGGIFSLVPSVVGEIGINSFDHNLGNWPDIPGIFFAYNLNQRRVVLADRGQGILATLSHVRQLSGDKEALRVAFTETISGRSPEARGNGLKLVRNIVTSNPFSLVFQSGNAELKLNQTTKSVDVREVNDIVRGCFTVIDY